MRFNRWIAPLALALAALIVPRANAEITEDSGKFEIFTGWYFPDDFDSNQDENFDDLTLGVRGGYHFTQHFGLMFGVQNFSTDADISPAPENLDVEAWFLDVSFVWFANPEDKAVFMLFGGPGYAARDFDFEVANAADHSFDNVSAHVGIGGEIQCTKRFYIRPEAAARWIQGDDDGTGTKDIEDTLDWQIGVAWGWYIGN